MGRHHRASFYDSSSSYPPSSSSWHPSVGPSSSWSGSLSASWSRSHGNSKWAHETSAATTTAATTATSSTYFPLTTVFTPPPSCAEIPYTYSTQNSGLSTFWRGQNQTACFPDHFPFQTANATATYSPGVCPSGYAAASTATNAQSAATMSWCCPSGMSYAQDYGCFATITTPTVVMLAASESTTMTAPFVAAEYYIQVAWADSQLGLFTPVSAPVLTASSTATSNSSSNGSPFMTTEQIAGMSIGVPVAVAVIALACYTLWRRKRRSSQTFTTDGDEEEDSSPSSGVMTEYKRSDSAQVESPESITQKGLQRNNNYHSNLPTNIPEVPPQLRQQRFSFGGIPELPNMEQRQTIDPRQQQHYIYSNPFQDPRQSMDQRQQQQQQQQQQYSNPFLDPRYTYEEPQASALPRG